LLTARRFWLGLAVSAVFLFLFLWRVDFQEVRGELGDGGKYLYLGPAVLLYFFALGIRCLRWRYLLLHLKPVSPLGLYPIVAIGYMANNLLPIRLGELVRAHFLGEKEGISKASGLATIGVERMMDGLTLLLLVATVWPFLPWTEVLRDDAGNVKSWWLVLSILVILSFVGGFAALVLLALRPQLGNALVRRVAGLLPPAFQETAARLGLQLMDGLVALRSPRKLLLMCLLSAPVWLVEVLVYYVMALAFDLGQPFQVILLVTATSNLATAVPSSIGGIGPFEVVAKSTLLAFAVGGDVATAYVFFVHIITLWLPVSLLGLAFLWRENLSLTRLARSKELSASPAGGLGTDSTTGEGETR